MLSATVLAVIFAVSTANADAAYQAKQYDRAAQLYADVVRDDPGNARAWYRLGVADTALRHNADAKAALTKSLALGYDAMSVHYRLAALAAAQDDARTAVSELEAATAARPIPPEALTGDDAFANISKTPQFSAFIDAQNRAFHPCRYDQAYHAMDFWVGDWNVTVQNAPAGTSHIEQALDGCAILEAWHGTYGADGRSISSYDAGSKRWSQHYVTARGAVSEYTGTVLSDGSVQFITGTGRTLTRMTYTRLPNGSVRQRFEQTSDGGTTWKLASDLIYSKK